MKLHIHLREGFQDDTLQMIVNGQMVWEADHLSTDYTISLAAQKEIELAPGEVQIVLKVPTRNLEETANYTLLDEAYLGISLQAQQLHLSLQADPFYYL